MKFFHGANQSGPYFEGWYLKHQSREGRTLAIIPALHIDGEGRRRASLQVVADSGSWWLEYPETQLWADPERFRIRLGESEFGRRGIRLDIRREGISLRGTVSYGPFTTLGSDIMGPFRRLGGMQCSHTVISMGHRLRGSVTLNGQVIDFSDGMGYIEGDRGRSFPSAYLWSQCTWRQQPRAGSLMLAVATIPLAVGGFTGCICAVFHRGREYRLATYRGARLEEWSPAGVAIRQGKYRLTAQLLGEQPRPLRAPVEGRMERTIHESLCAHVVYHFWRGNELLFRQESRRASFERAGARGHGGVAPAATPYTAPDGALPGERR